MAAVPYSDLPAGVMILIDKDPVTGWPARPTSRADLKGVWRGADPPPSIVGSGTGGALNGDVNLPLS